MTVTAEVWSMLLMYAFMGGVAFLGFCVLDVIFELLRRIRRPE